MLRDQLSSFFDWSIKKHRHRWEKAHPGEQYQACRTMCIEHLSSVVSDDGYVIRSADFMLRDKLVELFAWAIPSEEAIGRICEHSPRGVIEIGCGGGYWAWAIRQSGLDVVAYDKNPGKSHGRNEEIKLWISDIKRGDENNAGDSPEKSLLLCWPSYNVSWGAAAVEKYLSAGGTTVFYVGEGGGGCTGDDRLEDILCCDMEEVDTVEIPQWDGIHDYLRIFRKG